MTLTRKMAGLGTAFAIAAILFATMVYAAGAQQPPYTAFGIGLAAGDTVEVFVAGELAGTATADADGQWVVTVDGNEGDQITFAKNGVAQAETATWTAGGASPVPNGQTLTDAAVAPPAPDPSDTGNAGLLGGSAGASMALVMLLGIAAATLVAGARTATRRS
jgi:hypothetical protein